MTKIVQCTCQHAYQDATYGKGKRVANEMKTPGKSRCTVCGMVHS